MKPGTLEVLALLRARPSGLTAFDALAEVGCFRLAARIGELRADGYDIATETITTGSGKHVARYVIHERPVQLALLDPVVTASASFPKSGGSRDQVAERQPLAGSRFG